MPTRLHARRTRLPALLLAAGLGLMACSSGGSLDSTAGGAGDEEAPTSTEGEAPAAARDEGGGADLADGEALASYRSSAVRDAPAPDAPGLAPAVIQIGTMTVQSDDVAAARFDLEKVVDAYGGSIADEKTTATSEGDVELSKVVMRVPSDDFDAAMADLAKLGKVTASTRKAQDVTGEVIDTRARIRAQEQSLARVEVLFARAQSIRDIVAIEAQLSRRQAELDSLKGQLAWLEDQTSLSTITVYLEPTPEKPEPTATKKDDDTAFVSGLRSGWDALTDVGAGLATVAGALLPFALVGLLLGVPAALVARRWLVRHPLRRPTAEV
jgi:hypothetical protein